MTLQNLGIGIFIAVAVTNFFGLIFDFDLLKMGYQTVSERVWAGAWWIGVVILLWQLVGGIGLAIHFFASPTATL